MIFTLILFILVLIEMFVVIQSFNKRIKSETETLMMAKANLEKLKADVSARD